MASKTAGSSRRIATFIDHPGRRMATNSQSTMFHQALNLEEFQTLALIDSMLSILR